MVNLVPPPDSVMNILTTTGALRQGHFVYPNGKHASHYVQMPLAFRHYDNARVLSVGLSRMFRMEKNIAKMLPNVSIVSPSPGGIMVAFGVREALSANQIYWAEIEEGKRQFRQYIHPGDILPAIIVDDINRSGKAIRETIAMLRDLNAQVIGIGTIAAFEDAPQDFDGIPAKSLLKFDVNFYGTEDEWKATHTGPEPEAETVRF